MLTHKLRAAICSANYPRKQQRNLPLRRCRLEQGTHHVVNCKNRFWYNYLVVHDMVWRTLRICTQRFLLSIWAVFFLQRFLTLCLLTTPMCVRILLWSFFIRSFEAKRAWPVVSLWKQCDLTTFFAHFTPILPTPQKGIVEVKDMRCFNCYPSLCALWSKCFFCRFQCRTTLWRHMTEDRVVLTQQMWPKIMEVIIVCVWAAIRYYECIVFHQC